MIDGHRILQDQSGRWAVVAEICCKASSPLVFSTQLESPQTELSPPRFPCFIEQEAFYIHPIGDP